MSDLVKFEGAGTITRSFQTMYTPVTTVDEANRTVKARISTEDIDRSGDKLLADGCDFTNYKNNPVVTFGHDNSYPVGSCQELNVVPGDGVYATIKFNELADLDATNPVKQKVDAVWSMVKAGTLRGVSVEFRPIEGTHEKQSPDQTGMCYLKWELIDISIVPHPCNPNALIRSLKANPGDTELIFPAEVAKIRKGEPVVDEVARAADSWRRSVEAARRIVDSAQVKAMVNGIHSVACWLGHEQKSYPDTWDKGAANRAQMSDFVSPEDAAVVDKAYVVSVLVADQAIGTGVTEEFMNLGKLLGSQYVPDDQAERLCGGPLDCLYADDEEEPDEVDDLANPIDEACRPRKDETDFETEGCQPKKPRECEVEGCKPRRRGCKPKKSLEDSVEEQADAPSNQQAVDAATDGGQSDGMGTLTQEEIGAIVARAIHLATCHDIGGNRHGSYRNGSH